MEWVRTAQFILNANEINEALIKYVHEMFKGKEIEITISDIFDETDYLNKSDANRHFLLNAISDIENQKNLKEVNISVCRRKYILSKSDLFVLDKN